MLRTLELPSACCISLKYTPWSASWYSGVRGNNPKGGGSPGYSRPPPSIVASTDTASEPGEGSDAFCDPSSGEFWLFMTSCPSASCDRPSVTQAGAWKQRPPWGSGLCRISDLQQPSLHQVPGPCPARHHPAGQCSQRPLLAGPHCCDFRASDFHNGIPCPEPSGRRNGNPIRPSSGTTATVGTCACATTTLGHRPAATAQVHAANTEGEQSWR